MAIGLAPLAAPTARDAPADPSAFARFAIYAGIGMSEVFALFTYSLRVEERMRRQGYAPEWR